MADSLLEANIPDVVRSFEKLRRDQVPFATALALTTTAKDAQEEVRRTLPDRFQIRRKWVQSGIRITAARKTNLEAEIYSRDEFMLLQELGGSKSPRGRSIALPRAVRRGESVSRRPRARVVTRRNRPRDVLQQTGTFIAPVRGGDRGIFKREGPGRYPIRFLYRLHSGSVRIKSRFRFEETVQGVVAKRWEKNFGKALGKALATAR